MMFSKGVGCKQIINYDKPSCSSSLAFNVHWDVGVKYENERSAKNSLVEG
jgi:hypothetical protein